MNSYKGEIYLAGGCFWGIEAYFRRIHGVIQTETGYANGTKENPTYQQVCSQETGHAETVHIIYDKREITITKLIQAFFYVVDPLALNRQGNDIGTQYRSGIYYVDQADYNEILSGVKEEQKKYKEVIVTEIQPLSKFYLAEEYHQNYLEKNPEGYCHINLRAAEDFMKIQEETH